MRPYPSYKESGVEWIGEIPNSWNVTKIKYETVFPVQYGINIGSESYVDEGIRFIRTTDITDDGNLIDGGVYLDSDDVEDIYRTQLNDFLISRSGTLGRTYLHSVEDDMTYGGYLVRFNFSDKTKSEFIFYYTKTKNFEDWLSLNTIQSTIGNVNGQKYSNLSFPIPSPTEQHQIVSFLDTKTQKIDELIEKTEKKIELLKEKRTSLINHCVTKGLNPNMEMKDSGIEWLGEIPIGWETRKLKYILKKKPNNGIFKKKDEFGDGVRLVNVGDMYDEKNFINQKTLDRVLVNESELEKYKVQNYNLFFVRSSLKLEGIGVSSIIDNLEEPTVFECHIIRIIPNQSIINPYYLKLYLNSNLTRNRFISISQTVTMTTISQDHITSMEIVYPPLHEQAQIVEYLDGQTQKIDSTIERETQRIELLKEYRQSLISEVVTGKIDVRDEVVA